MNGNNYFANSKNPHTPTDTNKRSFSSTFANQYNQSQKGGARPDDSQTTASALFAGADADDDDFPEDNNELNQYYKRADGTFSHRPGMVR
jgi:hypothetical protein